MSTVLERIVFATIATLLSPVSRGQERIFEIHGLVVAFDRPVASVEVSLHSKEYGRELTTFTDSDGTFSFTALSSGHYSLRAEAQGFYAARARAQELNIGQEHPTMMLRLAIELDFCSQTPVLPHYFRQLGPGNNEGQVTLSGVVKNEKGVSIQGAAVALYIPLKGRIASTHTNSDGSFSFIGLTVDKTYWIQVLSDGYFVGEFAKLDVLSGYESIYDDLLLEACEPGHCDPSLRMIHITPGCE
jgi:hypothetical protein